MSIRIILCVVSSVRIFRKNPFTTVGIQWKHTDGFLFSSKNQSIVVMDGFFDYQASDHRVLIYTTCYNVIDG